MEFGEHDGAAFFFGEFSCWVCFPWGSGGCLFFEHVDDGGGLEVKERAECCEFAEGEWGSFFVEEFEDAVVADSECFSECSVGWAWCGVVSELVEVVDGCVVEWFPCSGCVWHASIVRHYSVTRRMTPTCICHQIVTNVCAETTKHHKLPNQPTPTNQQPRQ